MVDRCVMCNAIVPEGTHTCLSCQNSSSSAAISCPDCGAVLKVIHANWSYTTTGILHSSIFHCNCCHSDYEKEIEYVRKPERFHKKFWG